MKVANRELERAPKLNKIDNNRFYNNIQRLRSRFSQTGYLLPALVLLITVILYPVIYSIYISFRRTLAGVENIFIGLGNFKDVLGDTLFRHALVNTLIYMSLSVTLSFVIGFGVAILVQSISRGRDFFRVMLIIPLSMAPLIVALMWRWMFNPLFGMINWFFGLVGLPLQEWINGNATAMAVVIFVDVWQWYPLVFLIIMAGLAGLPRQPIEAAYVDGASGFYTFRRVTLPMLKPVILVALLLRTIDSFRVFDNVYMLTTGGPGYSTETLSLFVYRTGFQFNNLGKAGAGALFMVFGLGVISLIFFRLMYQEVEK
ncbi:MAG: sugar ABC transporter permease [Actinobacteria bacterium]|nr:sugar ABC transporter permease [Actinomycetota bacterium]